MSTADIANFVGISAVDLLEALNPELVRPDALRKTVLENIAPDVMLRDKTMRRALMRAMHRKDIVDLAEHLDVDVGDDPYGVLRSMNFRKNSSIEKSLFSFFEIDVPYEDEEKKIDSEETVEPTRGLYDYQNDVQYDILKQIQENGHRVMLHMPTGSGKTRIAMRVVATHMLENKNALVVWLAYSEELCEQAVEEYVETWKTVGNRPTKIVRFYRKFTPGILSATNNSGGVLLVAGLKKIYNAARTNNSLLSIIGDRTSFVVFDEAHQAVAPTYKMVLSHIAKSQATMVLGISATPGRTWNEPNTDQELSNFFNQKKVTINESSPVEFLISKGFLARPINRSIDFGVELTDEEIESINRSLDIPEDVLRQLSINTARNVQLVEHIERLVNEQHKRIIFFSATVDHARSMAVALTVRGFTANYVTSQTPPHERVRIINEFKNSDGTTKILCNYGVLTAGFDAPKTSAAVLARPTKSLVLYSQMVGRATRGKRVGGNAECVIVTVADMEKYGFGAITDAFANWDDVW